MNDVLLLASGGEAPSGIQVIIPSWSEIFWSTIIIGIIAIAFWKFLLPKFTAILDERTEKIEAGLTLAETVKAEAAQAQVENERLLAEARVEAAKLREQARIDGASIIAEMRAQAVVEAERVTTAAQRQIDSERQQAMTSLRLDVGDLAIQLASKIVGESLADEARQSRVVDRFIEDLEASELGLTSGGQ